MLRYVGAALPASLALVLSCWAAPASATVCFGCITVACDLVVETVSDCQVVPSNHELVIRATCMGLISVDALPLVRRTNGELVPGVWEPLSGYGAERFRFVGAEFPAGEELHLVGRAPQRCHVADVPSCNTSNLVCIEDELEPKDCCRLYGEAALDPAGEGQGGQGGQGGTAGTAGSASEQPLWLRFFASEQDQTPPPAHQVSPVCTGDGVDSRTLYWDAPGPFEDVQQVRFTVESEADADSLLILQSRTPCLQEPELWVISKDGDLDFGVHRIRTEYRDWSGNLALGPEHVLNVPEDCLVGPFEAPIADRSFSCDLPTYPFDEACLARPRPGVESVPPSEPVDLCSRFTGPQDTDEDLPDLELDDPLTGLPSSPGTGGSLADDDATTPGPPRAGSGCACASVGPAGHGRLGPSGLVAGLCVVLLLGRRKRQTRAAPFR
jgi:hypothetical protein